MLKCIKMNVRLRLSSCFLWKDTKTKRLKQLRVGFCLPRHAISYQTQSGIDLDVETTRLCAIVTEAETRRWKSRQFDKREVNQAILIDS